MAATVLEHLGYVVLNADSPGRVIELCRDQIRQIDLLIVNLDTLELRGDELADLAKTFRPGIKILYISSLEDPSAAPGAGKPGIAVLRKPFTPLALAEKVREILDRE